MVNLYRPPEQLQNLATAVNIPYSDKQYLKFGLTLIWNTRDFEKALSEWKNKPAADKTLVNFKLHLKNAQAELKKIRGLVMQQAGYHHANIPAA